MAAVVLALGAAALWGTGDFFGGLASRRMSVLIVLFWSQLAGLAGLVVWIVVSGAARPGARRARRRSRPGSRGGRARLPLPGHGRRRDGDRGADLGHLTCRAARASTFCAGRSPAAVQWLGIVFALVGVVLVSREPGAAAAAPAGRGRRRPGAASPPSASACSSSASARPPRRAHRGRPATARFGSVGSARARARLDTHRPRVSHACPSSWPSGSSTPGRTP